MNETNAMTHLPSLYQGPAGLYYPLGIEDRIRIIFLLPGDWKDPIKCELRHTALSHKPRYHALSYAWGSSKATRPVTVNYVELDITVNLESALRHLRRKHLILPLWVDALCINQNNLDERGHQVRIMRDIYAHASEVIVYLGDGLNHRTSGYCKDFRPPFEAEFHGSSLDSGYIAGFFERWVANDVPRNVSAMDVFSFIAAQARGQGELFYHEANEKGRDLEKLFEALRMMLLSPWWIRMWVFQEAIMAQKLTVRYGGITCPWSMFTQAAYTWSAAALLVSDSVRKVMVFFSKLVIGVAQNRESRAPMLGEQQPGHEAADMLALLRATAARKATNDRDKVFALLGLVQANMKRVIFPSYETSTEDVYTTTVSQIIAQGRSLAPLYGDLGRKNRKDLPSWVPDWSAVIDGHEINRIHYISLYNACGNGEVEFISSIRTLWSYASSYGYYMKNMPSLDDLRVSREYELLTEEAPAPLWMNKIRLSDHDDKGFCQLKGCHLLGRYVATVKEVGEVIVGPITPGELCRLCRSYSELGVQHPMRLHALRALVFYLKIKDGHIMRLTNNDDDAIQQWFGSRLDNELRGQDDRKTATDVYGLDETDPLGLDEIVARMAPRRRLFVTGNDRLGWGPAETQPGDHVYVLPGGQVPFVLRGEHYVGQDNAHRLIGDCILQGVMDGETCRNIKWGAVLLPPLSWTGYDSYMERKGQDTKHHRLEWKRHLVNPFYFVYGCLQDRAEENNLVMVTLI